MAIDVSEDLIRAVTTKDKALSDGRTLAKKGAFANLFQTADASLLWGQCQGSGAKPYEISVDLAGDTPILRCSCPVKPPPCKHTLGFLVAFLEKRDAFKAAEAPPELAEKRAKSESRAEKRAESAAKPKEVNVAAARKKVATQRAAIDELLEPLLLDVVLGGLGTVDKARAQKLSSQAKQLDDAFLPGAAERLRRLAALAAAGADDDDDVYYQLREPGDDLPDHERQRLMSRHLTRLWAMVKKGRKYLEERLEEGESQDDADAVVEELLGRIWKLEELRAKGAVKQGLTLLELAFERFDDRVRQERVEQSHLCDLADGTIYVDRTYRPIDRLDKMKEGESYEKPLLIAEAAIYPGFVNKRVRWEIAARKSKQLERSDFERLHAVALGSFDLAVAKFKDQLKKPLAPDDAIFLVRAVAVHRHADGLLLLDEKGQKLSLRNSPLSRYPSLGNFEIAAGAAQGEAGKLPAPSSVLVRLFVGLADDAIHGQPLALVAGHDHVRVGM